MIRLPQNVDQIRSERLTMRFNSKQECGYVMLFEAGAAYASHDLAAIDAEENDDGGFDGYRARRPEELEAARVARVNNLNATRFENGGQHCLIVTVGEAIRMVPAIEQIKKLSRMGVAATAHNFTTAQVEQTCTEVLERFERDIQQVAELANTQDLGMFMPGPGPGN